MAIKYFSMQCKQLLNGVDLRRVGLLTVAFFIILNSRFKFTWVGSFIVFVALYVSMILLSALVRKLKKQGPFLLIY